VGKCTTTQPNNHPPAENRAGIVHWLDPFFLLAVRGGGTVYGVHIHIEKLTIPVAPETAAAALHRNVSDNERVAEAVRELSMIQLLYQYMKIN
jgi:hypothetical protein